MEELAKWGWAIALLFNALLTLIVWSMRNAFATKADVAALDRRVTVAETALDAVPSEKALHEIANGLEALRGDVKGMAAEVHGWRDTINRVERPLNLLMEHHLKGR